MVWIHDIEDDTIELLDQAREGKETYSDVLKRLLVKGGT